MANFVPDDVINAAQGGDVGVVRHWLESGGDPNWNLVDPNSHHFPCSYRLILFTAEHDQRDVMKVLIAHGADVHYLYRYESSATMYRALDVAIYGDKNEAARLLIENGANASRLNPDGWVGILVNHQLLRILLAAGADINALCCCGQTPEARARQSVSSLMGRGMDHRAAIYKETVSILEVCAAPVRISSTSSESSRSCFEFAPCWRAGARGSDPGPLKPSRASSAGGPTKLDAHARRHAASDPRRSAPQACPTPSSGR